MLRSVQTGDRKTYLFEVRQAPLNSLFGCYLWSFQKRDLSVLEVFPFESKQRNNKKVGFSNLGLLGGTPTLEPKAVWKSQKRMQTNASRICFDGFDIFK